MKTRYVLVLLVVSLLVAGCIGGGTQTEKTDEQLAIAQVEKFLNGYRLTDAATMGEVVAPIIMLTGEGVNDPYSREEFVTGFQAMFDNHEMFPEDWIPPTYGPLKAVTVSGNIAIRVDVSRLANDWENIWTFTLVKSSGKWLINEWNVKVNKTLSE